MKISEAQAQLLFRWISILVRKSAGLCCLIVFGTTVACSKKPPKEPLAPPPTDQFSGKTVIDGVHAQDMMMFRLGNAPTPGQRAPDGELIAADSGEIVRMSDLWENKPVVLIFGSGSCKSINFLSENIDRLSERFAEDADFYFVYIREAHPEGGFNLQITGRLAEVEVAPVVDAVVIKERCEAALNFQKYGGSHLPALVDSLNDSAAIQWGAWPSRIFVVGPGGIVLYASDQGPWFFDVSKDGWKHYPPPAYVDQVLRKRSFDRISLEEFLENHFKGG